MNLKKLLVGGLASVAVATSLFGAKVTVVKTNVAEETFQMEIVSAVLEKMGHEVTTTNDVNYDIAYQEIANNAKGESVYFLSSAWFPLHNGKLASVSDKVTIVVSKINQDCKLIVSKLCHFNSTTISQTTKKHVVSFI